MYCTAVFRNIPLSPRWLVPGTLRWTPGRTWVRHQPPGGQHRCFRCGRKSRYSGAPQSRSSTQCRWSQCCSWSSRRRQTSWWRCRRLSPILHCCSRLWSRTLPFQFVVVEGETSIFKVFLPDRVQQLRFFLWNAFLSRLWSRTLTFPFLEVAFKIFAQDRGHPQLRTFQLLGSTLRMSRFKGFFALFPRRQKCS